MSHWGSNLCDSQRHKLRSVQVAINVLTSMRDTARKEVTHDDKILCKIIVRGNSIEPNTVRNPIQLDILSIIFEISEEKNQ